MSIEIGLLTEALLAMATSEWTFAFVNVPNVPLQIRGDGKTSVAELAHVRLFT